MGDGQQAINIAVALKASGGGLHPIRTFSSNYYYFFKFVFIINLMFLLLFQSVDTDSTNNTKTKMILNY